MTARNLFAHFIWKADSCQIAADLPGRVIDDPEAERFEIVKFLPHFGMDTFAEFLYIHANFRKGNTYKRPFAIFILKGIMHARADCRFDHHGSTRWLVYFPTIDRQMGVAISPSEVADRPADLVTRHKKEDIPHALFHCL